MVVAMYRRFKFLTMIQTTRDLRYVQALNLARERSQDRFIAEVQILICMREYFSPGGIDGRWQINTRRGFREVTERRSTHSFGRHDGDLTDTAPVEHGGLIEGDEDDLLASARIRPAMGEDPVLPGFGDISHSTFGK